MDSIGDEKGQTLTVREHQAVFVCGNDGDGQSLLVNRARWPGKGVLLRRRLSLGGSLLLPRSCPPFRCRLPLCRRDDFGGRDGGDRC